MCAPGRALFSLQCRTAKPGKKRRDLRQGLGLQVSGSTLLRACVQHTRHLRLGREKTRGADVSLSMWPTPIAFLAAMAGCTYHRPAVQAGQLHGRAAKAVLHRVGRALLEQLFQDSDAAAHDGSVHGRLAQVVGRNEIHPGRHELWGVGGRRGNGEEQWKMERVKGKKRLARATRTPWHHIIAGS